MSYNKTYQEIEKFYDQLDSDSIPLRRPNVSFHIGQKVTPGPISDSFILALQNAGAQDDLIRAIKKHNARFTNKKYDKHLFQRVYGVIASKIKRWLKF